MFDGKKCLIDDLGHQKSVLVVSVTVKIVAGAGFKDGIIR